MRERNFVVDIGNTNIVLGIYIGQDSEYFWRLKTDDTQTEDEYFSVINSLFADVSLSVNEIKNIAISSVVPTLTQIFSVMANKYFPEISTKIIDAKLDLGLSFAVENPDFIGADLLVNAFAAKEKYQTNCIICDFGTATTVQLIGADGYFYGTAIIPGVKTSAKNLFQIASQLSETELENPQNILGKSTKESLLSGIINGNLFMIDGFVRAIREKYGNLGEIKAIATGGLASTICENSREIDLIDVELTLDGLNLICQK
ncbi:MAG: type III pantothenate kinase [Candidatus Cloacimonetes bacterium]|nr:type III pantothenate kinase [Candidatus Cloacimonadota bacterium]MBT6993769.1 type III pantothenate kinase [Candidatus Cloacimonadota bacterium]MBT7468951.1 type III pantothenate kinase [Candidatus Cloacimonadota bacterium]